MKKKKEVSKRKKELQEIGETLDVRPEVQAKRDRRKLKNKCINNCLKGKKSMRIDNRTIIYADTKIRLRSMQNQINELKN